jgi:hypothetical protein
LTDLTADLLDCIHRPENVKMLILVNNFRVDETDVRLAAALKPVQKPAAINKSIRTTDPKRERGCSRTEPRARRWSSQACILGIIAMLRDGITAHSIIHINLA